MSLGHKVKPCKSVKFNLQERIKSSLDVLNDVRTHYRKKLCQLDDLGTKYNVNKLKTDIYEDWVSYLQEENSLLVKLISEIEKETFDQSENNKCNCDSKEVQVNIDGNTRLILEYKNDVCNLMKLIRRMRENENWNLCGLRFYHVAQKELVKYIKNNKGPIDQNVHELIQTLKKNTVMLQGRECELQKELKSRENVIELQQETIKEISRIITDCDTRRNFQYLSLQINKLNRSLQNEIYKIENGEKVEAENLKVVDCPKDLTSDLTKIWRNIVGKNCSDPQCARVKSNCHLFYDKNDEQIAELKRVISEVTTELKNKGSLTGSDKNPIIFFVVDKNKKSN